MEDEIDNFPLDVGHRAKKLTDKNNRLDALYDTIEEIENLITELEEKKQAIENNVLTMESIYKILLHFDKVYDRLSGDEQKKLLASFINRITLNEGETIEERTLKVSCSILQSRKGLQMNLLLRWIKRNTSRRWHCC